MDIMVKIRRLGESTELCGVDGTCGAPATYRVEVLDLKTGEKTDPRFDCQRHTLELIAALGRPSGAFRPDIHDKLDERDEP